MMDNNKNKNKTYKQNEVTSKDEDAKKRDSQQNSGKMDISDKKRRTNSKKKDFKRNNNGKISEERNRNPRNGEIHNEDSKSSLKLNPFYTISGRNGMIVDVPSAYDADFSVLDIDLDLSALLKQPSDSSAFLSSNFCDSLDTIVKTYSTSRGYITSVTGKVIANVLRLSMRAFSLLTTIWRTQAAYNLKAQNGFNVGPMFYRKSVQSVNSSLALSLAENIPSPMMIDESATISNAIWMRDYVSYLNLMYLPKVLVDVLSYLYKNAFTAEVGKGLGTSSLLLMWPISGNTALVTAYASTIAELQLQFRNYPDLELLLKVCGFDNKFAIDVDFTRPLAANVLNIVYDPSIPRLLENLGPLDCGYATYIGDYYATYKEYDDIGSIFGFKELTTIEASHNILYWLLNFNALANLGVSIYPATGDLCQVNGGLKVLGVNSIQERLYIPDNIQFYFRGWSGIASVYLPGLNTIMTNVASIQASTRGISGLSSIRTLFVKINVSVDEENELSFQIQFDSVRILDGVNNYTYDENEACVIMQNMLPTLIYGAEWRSKLQMVYENIANSVSGITY